MCRRDPPLTWDSFGRALMTRQCTPCHSSLLPADQREGAPPTINFDTYQDVLDHADRIAATAVPDDGTMPPGGGPSAEERAMLDEWLRCEVAADRATLGMAP